MKVTLFSAPASEPVTLAELKSHLLLDSGDFIDNVDSTQTIAPGSHAVTVVTTYSLVGTAVDVLNYSSIVELISGTNGATGTVDAKIQDSDDSSTWTDWTGGAFTQITTANDNATYRKAYTGIKQYIRVVCKVLNAPCEFGVSVLRKVSTTEQDDLLIENIQSAREQVEDDTRRALITQTWDIFLENWPGTRHNVPLVDAYFSNNINDCRRNDYIKIPFGNLQSVTSVKWKDTDGVETALTAGTDYIVETNGDQCGRIVLPYGKSWPSGTLYPSNPIIIRFVCGYGTAASVPAKLKQAIKRLCSFMQEDRGEMVYSARSVEDTLYGRLIQSRRLFDEFEYERVR